VGPHCSFCGTSTGPFQEVEGLFTVLMCTDCQAVRRGRPAELLAGYDPAEPWLKWTCPIEDCGHRVVGMRDLEGHAATEHPGWIARFEVVRPYPNQHLRVVYRQIEDPTG
jgi:hypothetical protein